MAKDAETKICKKCKEEINKKAKRCPKCGANLGMPGIVKVLIVLAIIIGCVVGCMGACTKGVSDAIDQAVEDNKNEHTDINGKTEFKVGETFENKHFKVTVTNVDINWTGYDKSLKPKEENKIVKISITAENIGSDSDDISYLYFKCYADGVKVDEYIWSDDYTFGGSISSSKKTVGALYYEVPKIAKEINLEYEPNVLDNSYHISYKIQ